MPNEGVCVAVPTYRRRDRLSSLLDALSRQRLPSGMDACVAVFDNDPTASARGLILARRQGYRFPLHYKPVPKPGLSEVRNAAVDFASHTARFIAMIDDDEIPERDWLSELLRVGEVSGADAVIGPVSRQFPMQAPHWIRAGKFFNDSPIYADGSFVSEGYSGNCLMVLASLARMKVRFDPSMNLAGGEDVLFFRELLSRGGRVAYAANARAVEFVDPNRLTPSYVLFRNLRTGNTLARCDRKLDQRLAPICVRLIKGFGRIVLGAAALLPGTALQGFRGTMIALCGFMRGCGMILGVAGVQVLEYRRR